MSKQTQYRRIYRYGRLGGSSSIWESESHLLLVRNSVLAETYRRFYFRDIQAVMILQNHYRLFNALMLGVLVLPAIALFATSIVRGWDIAATITISISTAALLAPFVINLTRGPCCKCFLQTSVQRDILDPITRVRDARRVLDQIRPRIESLQGELGDDQLDTYSIDIAEPRADVPKPPPRPLRVIKVTFHKAVYLLMLLGAATSLFMLVSPGNHKVIAVGGAVIIVASFVCNIGALFRQFRSTLAKSLRVLTWCALAYLCTGVFVSWLYSIVHAFESLNHLGQGLGEAGNTHDPIYSTILLVDSLLSAALGLVGLLMLRAHGRTLESPRPSPPPHPPQGRSQDNADDDISGAPSDE
jgi:hypothetical protein